MLYTVDVIPAEGLLAEAEQAGAEETAPFEYWSAREYLRKAHEESSEASYEEAVRYAQTARRFAEAARDRARQARGVSASPDRRRRAERR